MPLPDTLALPAEVHSLAVDGASHTAVGDVGSSGSLLRPSLTQMDNPSVQIALGQLSSLLFALSCAPSRGQS